MYFKYTGISQQNSCVFQNTHEFPSLSLFFTTLMTNVCCRERIGIHFVEELSGAVEILFLADKRPSSTVDIPNCSSIISIINEMTLNI